MTGRSAIRTSPVAASLNCCISVPYNGSSNAAYASSLHKCVMYPDEMKTKPAISLRLFQVARPQPPAYYSSMFPILVLASIHAPTAAAMLCGASPATAGSNRAHSPPNPSPVGQSIAESAPPPHSSSLSRTPQSTGTAALAGHPRAPTDPRSRDPPA